MVLSRTAWTFQLFESLCSLPETVMAAWESTMEFSCLEQCWGCRLCRQCLCTVPGLWSRCGCRAVLGCCCGGLCSWESNTWNVSKSELGWVMSEPRLRGSAHRAVWLCPAVGVCCSHLSTRGWGFPQAASWEILNQSHRNRPCREQGSKRAGWY